MEDEEIQEKSFCFLNAERVCDMTCTAYLATRPAGPDYENQVFSQCLLLVNTHKTGKHLTILAGELVETKKQIEGLGGELQAIRKHFRISEADAKRAKSSGM